MNNLILEINSILKEIKEVELQYERKNKSLNKMITNISHDLRTPLTSAMGYINIILKSNINEKDKIKYLKIIEERLERLDELINSFFEFSKIISSNEEPKINKIDIVAIIEKCVVSFYDDFSKHNRVIDLKCNKNKIYIYSNEMMLRRIFDNLLSNALKHDDGNLQIEINENNAIEILFENDLKYEVDIENVFDEFYSTDISRTNGNTGLGLAIVKDFVERLDGEVKAIKEDNKFKINIILKK